MTHSAAELARLIGEPPPTEEQAAVIEAPLGASLVIAGAGSGKTTTMGHRVVWLVANGHARPDEVLGLTFTRKAARELREKVNDFLARLGTGTGRGEGEELLALVTGPVVSTYNAFAAGVYRDHALAIGREPEAEVLSEAAAWQLARRVVIDSRVPGLARLDRTIGTLVDDVLELAHELSDNAVASSEAVLAYAERLLELRDADRLPLGDRFERRELVDRITRLESLRVLLPVVEEFQTVKRRRGVMEYSDQVVSALAIAETSPEAVAALRERHRFVLLDEYQDTSVVQTRLLAALFRTDREDVADAASPTGRAIVAVGDPNQSIYGWRGASDANLADFARDFGAPGLEPLQLTTSWRNPPQVLDAANAISRVLRATARVHVDPLRLRPGAVAGRFDVIAAERIEEEAEAVAGWLRDRLREGEPTAAVLTRKRKHLPVLAAALTAAGVPHRVLGVGGLLETPEVTDVVAALRVLVEPDAGSALIRLLVGARWQIGVADLAVLDEFAGIVHRQRDGRGGDGAALVDGLDALVDARDDWEVLDSFSSEGLARLRDAGETFRRLRSRLGVPLPDLVRIVEEELRLDIEVVANDTKPRGTANLREFREQIESFLRVDDLGTLRSLLQWVDRAIAAEERIGPADAPKEPGIVQLLTVHAAKGLEWDVVAIPRLVEQDFPDAPKDGSGWLAVGKLPYEFRGDADVLRDQAWFDWESATSRKELKAAYDRFADGLRERHDDEERRLAYVAVTRAKRDLLLAASFWPGYRGGPRRLSRYLADLEEAGLLPETLPRASALDADPSDPRAADLRWPLDPLGGRRTRVERAAQLVREAEAVNAEAGAAAGWARDLELLLAEHARVTRPGRVDVPTRIPASGFKEWVHDPDAVAARIRRPMPEQPYRATRLGTLFHAWVEARYRSSSPEALFDLDDPAADLDEERRGLAPADLGELDRLRATFERSPWAFRSPLAVEQSIELPFAGRTVPCKIDAVFADGDRIQIVDWKTGRKPSGGAELAQFDYQLDLYRLAWSRHTGVPLDLIDAAAYFVAVDEVHHAASRRTEEELLAEWEEVLQRLER